MPNEFKVFFGSIILNYNEYALNCQEEPKWLGQPQNKVAIRGSGYLPIQQGFHCLKIYMTPFQDTVQSISEFDQELC